MTLGGSLLGSETRFPFAFRCLSQPVDAFCYGGPRKLIHLLLGLSLYVVDG